MGNHTNHRIYTYIYIYIHKSVCVCVYFLYHYCVTDINTEEYFLVYKN